MADVGHPVGSAHATGAGYDAWREWGGSGPVLHLAHANGFPPGSYRQLIGELAGRHRVVTMESRPLWPGADPAAIGDWRPLADDLRLELRRRGLAGVVGVGHSFGGVVSALAAAADPGLFAALVLIDPVIFTGARLAAWRLARAAGSGHLHPLVRGARRRVDRWPDRDRVRAHYAGKPLFAGWAAGALDDYLEDGLVEVAGGVALRYPTAWEARLFEVSSPDVWRELHRLEVPLLFIRGARSDTFGSAAAARAVRDLVDARLVEVAETAHLVPMERPREVAAAIEAFLDERLGEVSKYLPDERCEEVLERHGDRNRVAGSPQPRVNSRQ